MSLAVWLGEDRKCSAAVVGLDLLLVLSMVRRCSLNRSFNPNNKSKPTTAAEHFLSSSNTCKNYLLKIYSQHGNFLNAIQNISL